MNAVNEKVPIVLMKFSSFEKSSLRKYLCPGVREPIEVVQEYSDSKTEKNKKRVRHDLNYHF